MNDGGSFEADFERTGAWIAAYLAHPERYPVMAQTPPGWVAAQLPAEAPEAGEPFERLIEDFERIVIPGVTHWNHPRFFAYFATSSVPAAIAAEALAATLDVKAMLWRTSPAATELEEVVMRWLGRLLGIDDAFTGIIYDTASIAGYTALAAARESLDLDIRRNGMTGRGLPTLRVYCTEHTHSHVEKAAIALGLGQSNVVRVACDEAFRMRADALDASIARDVADGMRPMAIVATAGTTSTTSVDPVMEIARVAKRHGVWLHVDAAYAGSAAIVPEMRWVLAGSELANSIVVNPHKWMFVPMDLSVLFVRNEAQLRRTFSLIPEYLQTNDEGVRNYMDYGLQLGRRFRALKLWFVLRHLGAEGIRERLREHVAMAGEFADWVGEEAEWEVLAPHPFSVVCFRFAPKGVSPDDFDALNAALLDAVNATGEIFVSHTKIDGRYALRLAIGNVRTTRDDVRAAWNVLRRQAARTRA